MRSRSVRAAVAGCLGGLSALSAVAASAACAAWIVATPAASAQSVIYAPSALTLPSEPIGTTSTALTLGFTVSGSHPVTVSSVAALVDGAAALDFQVVAQTCVGTFSSPTNCTVSVTFTPSKAGDRHGAVTLYDGAGHSIVSVAIHGVGLGAEPVLAVASASPVPATSLTPAAYVASTTVYDGAGNLYFNDAANARLLKRATDGTLSVVATGVLTGPNSHLTISATGTLLLSSSLPGTVYAITGSTVATLAYSGTQPAAPTGLAVDDNGYLYTADSATNTILRSAIDGSGASALPLSGLSPALGSPAGLTIGADGALYVVDTTNARLVRVDTGSYAATVVPLGSYSLLQPDGVTADASGNLYIADTGDARVIVASAAGATALAITGTQPLAPTDLVIDGAGNVVIADTIAGLLLAGRTTGALNFATPTPVFELDATDGVLAIVFSNVGNAAAYLSAGSGAVDSGAYAITTNSCATSAVGALPSGASCTYGISFIPTAVGANPGTLTVADGTVNSGLAAGQTTVTLSGTGTPSQITLSITVTPANVLLGTANSITLTVNGTNAALYRGTVTFTSTDPGAAFASGTTYTFTAADAGSHSFPAPTGVLFSRTGTFTVSVTDGIDSATSNPVTVTNPPAATSAVLTATPNPLQVGTALTLQANISCAATGAPPTGTVTFTGGGLNLTTALASATAGSGQAQVITSAFTLPGTYLLTATYSGDSNCSPATSSPVSVVVISQGSTTTTLTAAPTPILLAGSSLLTATVACATPAISPTGAVAFTDAVSGLIGSATLNAAGQGVLSFVPTPSGTHAITASYGGDANCKPSVSLPATVAVSDLAITLTNPAAAAMTVLPGSAAHFALTAAPVGTASFVAPVTLSVAGAPPGTVVAFTPASVAAGASSTPVTLTLTPPMTARLEHTSPLDRTLHRDAPLALAVLLLVPFTLRKRRRWLPSLLALLLLAGSTVGLSGCLSNQASGYFGTVPATYNIVVTATYGGALTRTVSVQLTVE